MDMEKNYWLNEWRRKKIELRQEKFIKQILTKERCDVYSKHTIRRFIFKIDVREENECWEWMKGKDKDGYGIYYYANKHIKAHRFMFLLVRGEILKDKPHVLHMCNNPSCCNPNHLKMGSHQDNMKHRCESGRNATCESHGKSKINWSIVKDIRKDYTYEDITIAELAVKYSLSETEIYFIINNDLWKDDSYTRPNISRHGIEHSRSAIRTWKDVNKIREEYKKGKLVSQLAKEYAIPKRTLYYIVRNETWWDGKYQQWLDGNDGDKDAK